MKLKTVLIFALVFIVFMALSIRLIYINRVQGSQFERQVLAQQTNYNRILQDKRGSIFDRNGTILANSLSTYNLILDPQVISVSRENVKNNIIFALENYFDIEKDLLNQYIENPQGRHYVPLIKNMSYEEKQNFQLFLQEENIQNAISGVWFEEEFVRNYPFEHLASHVLGFVNANEGMWGIEEKYNDLLKGETGRAFGMVSEGFYVNTEVKEPKNGNNIITTIDYTIQHYVERAVREFNETYEPLNTTVIAMNPNNGEILALANNPNYNPNDPRNLDDFFSQEEIDNLSSEERLNFLNGLWRSYAINNTYEPGSTFKPVTISAALEEGILTGDEIFECEGSVNVAGTRIGCWSREGHGEQTLSEVLANSCNVGMVQIGELMGKEIFVEYQRNFGFGERTNVDLLGEASANNLLYNVNNMGPVELATNTFGQTFNVTPIQLITAISSIINGGELLEPHIIKQIIDDNGAIIDSIDKKVVRNIISKDTADQVKEYMFDAVEVGTGHYASLEGYEIGGKTGTAEKLPRGNDKYVISFIGFTPIENPEIILLVISDEPSVPNASSSLVVSLFSEIMQDILPYLNIYPAE